MTASSSKMPSGPVTPYPISPKSLKDPIKKLSNSQLLIPTSTLYAASLPPTTTNINSKLKGQEAMHFGKYKKERLELDWNYHKIPTRERQELQDELLDLVLSRVIKECEEGNELMGSGSGGGNGNGCERDEVCTRANGLGEGGGRPLALFTAGGMGAGKGHTLKQFLRDGTIRLPRNFVWVDPDSLARSLPEREQYIKASSKTASPLLHPEASMLTEILSNIARTQKRSLVIDGSLTDCTWFKSLMKKYEEDGYGIEILFVYADEETMLERAKRRACSTGRVTNPESIKSSRIRSPECVTRLAKREHVMRVRLVDNASEYGPSKIVYDSAEDPSWEGGDKDCRVDVLGFVEGRLTQDEEGLIKVKASL